MPAKLSGSLDEHYGKEVVCLVGGCQLSLIYLYILGDEPSRSLYMDYKGVKYHLRNSKRNMNATGKCVSEEEITKICASALARSQARLKEASGDGTDSA